MLILIAVSAASCSNNDDNANPQIGVRAAEQLPTPTTPVPIQLASESEQEASAAMMQKYSDGGLTAEELELFILEAIQCTRRAGYEMTLIDFNPVTGAVTLAGPGSDVPELGPGNIAADNCTHTYYLPAVEEFSRTNGPSEAERLADEARQYSVLFACFADAGFEFTDINVALEDPNVPDDVRNQCLDAYSR